MKDNVVLWLGIVIVGSTFTAWLFRIWQKGTIPITYAHAINRATNPRKFLLAWSANVVFGIALLIYVYLAFEG
ncbi:hypothetical protein [Qipengyuania nanhaisediminis]|uniref:Uncharacterized protein n=1 Tax=Qipengyuania nanhaisediminis TaxID=604088 RepID=A0A1I5LCT0_9SPHN|nr:hypothetical protein [Qipengyuania nanhaisediminis]SFO95002.1 hypothetical protein SAMN04488060_0919 [Qipengyuania nanhaisediminis]